MHHLRHAIELFELARNNPPAAGGQQAQKIITAGMKIDQLETCLCIGHRYAVSAGFGTRWRVVANLDTDGDNPGGSDVFNATLSASVNARVGQGEQQVPGLGDRQMGHIFGNARPDTRQRCQLGKQRKQ